MIWSFDFIFSTSNIITQILGFEVVESGDRLDKSAKENILFMPNHQSTADVPLCMTLFNARGNFAGRVMWIMDRVFKYSNFGCVSWMHDDFFILAVSTILIILNWFKWLLVFLTKY